MSDRCFANTAALRLVEERWEKSLNQLHCHLHPLDSIATKSRQALSEVQERECGRKGECLAAVMVYKVSMIV